MRRLATIQKVTKLDSIQGYDRVELATVLGWQCVVSKNDNWEVGDTCIFIEPDSIVPQNDTFKFMSKYKFRVRSQRLCKVLSQGLVMPMSILPPAVGDTLYVEGDDVTDKLGITKYDPEAQQEAVDTKVHKWAITRKLMRFKLFRDLYKYFNRKSDDFPSFLRKTDEERIQNIPGVLKYNVGTKLIGTEKMNGSSTSFALTRLGSPLSLKSKFYVCSRNKLLRKPNNSNYWRIAKTDNIEKILRDNGGELCIQGEACGPSIQGNNYGFPYVCFFVFDIWDLRAGRRYTQDEMETFCKMNLLSHVPVVVRLIIEENMTPEDFVKIADKQMSQFGKDNTPAEGIVFRSEDWNERRISFKALSREFEIKYGGK